MTEPNQKKISLTAQKETFVPANDVSFSISTGRSNYGVREQITVKYQITNVSNGSVYVPRGFEATACLDGPQARPMSGPSLKIVRGSTFTQVTESRAGGLRAPRRRALLSG
jgi:hypothetical protein